MPLTRAAHPGVDVGAAVVYFLRLLRSVFSAGNVTVSIETRHCMTHKEYLI